MPNRVLRDIAFNTYVAPADLDATGTLDATTFLRGDGTWAAPPDVALPDYTVANPPAALRSIDAANFTQNELMAFVATLVSDLES